MNDMQAETLRQNFSHYASPLSELHEHIQAGVEPAVLPGFRYTYVDEHFVHSFDLPHGEVGLLFQADDEAEITLPEHVRDRAEAMQLAIGHKTLEQIVAYSDGDIPAIVTEATSKDALDEVGATCKESIPLDMYQRLFTTFRTMESLGLAPFMEYLSSIKYPEVTFETMDDEHDLAVTRYRRNDADSSFRTHVLSLGGEMARNNTPRGAPVPRFAINYYLACDKYIGKEMGLELVDLWLRRGNSIPPINYGTTLL